MMRPLALLAVLLSPLVNAEPAHEAKVPGVTVTLDAKDVTRHNGVVLVGGKPFSGWLVELRDGSTAARTPLLQGRPHGVAEMWYPSGALRSSRSFRFGLREGAHRGYWEDGSVQLDHRYHADLFEGEQVGYHPNGRVAELRHYKAGREEGLQRRYNAEGDVIANYTFKDGRRYGVVGRFDCISTAGE